MKTLNSSQTVLLEKQEQAKHYLTLGLKSATDHGSTVLGELKQLEKQLAH